MIEECRRCLRQASHGGNRIESINGPCLAFDEDPRGQLLEATESLEYALNEDIEIHKWTQSRWETENGYRSRYINFIYKIFWVEAQNTWGIKAATKYWEHGDGSEDEEYQLEKHLIQNGITNVVLLRRAPKKKTKW